MKFKTNSVTMYTTMIFSRILDIYIKYKLTKPKIQLSKRKN